ncbi:VgrG protein [Aliikangiella marina]|uniref:VgrG protein n=2 Tax=Aliikangiella marina TaxID=1712262 RepID=A0A545T396_9GAMM|nr:VgrG protein [Aliikangiella marina]
MNRHTLGSLQSVHLAQVVDNADPDARNKIKVRLLATEMEIWASVVVPSAGEGYGFSCLPKIEETVVIAFVSPEQACVLGSIWAGANSAPSEADPQEDHYLIQTPSGTVLEFDDQDGPKIEVKTSSGYSIKITEGEGGEIDIKRGGQNIKLTSSDVKISGTKVVVDASTIEMNAASVNVNASISKFSGVIQTDTIIATSVVGTTYTPGAGNIW